MSLSWDTGVNNSVLHGAPVRDIGPEDEAEYRAAHPENCCATEGCQWNIHELDMRKCCSCEKSFCADCLTGFDDLQYCSDCAKCIHVILPKCHDCGGDGYLQRLDADLVDGCRACGGSGEEAERNCGESALIRCSECGALVCSEHTFKHPLWNMCQNCGRREQRRVQRLGEPRIKLDLAAYATGRCP